MARFCPVRATGSSCVDGARLTAWRALPPFVTRIRMLLCGTSDNLPSVCWPGSCACRNLRIRTTGTPCRAGARASDLRGHWVYKGANGVGSALILRLRQNRPPTTAEAVHSPLSSPQARSWTSLGPGSEAACYPSRGILGRAGPGPDQQTCRRVTLPSSRSCWQEPGPAARGGGPGIATPGLSVVPSRPAPGQ